MALLYVTQCMPPHASVYKLVAIGRSEPKETKASSDPKEALMAVPSTPLISLLPILMLFILAPTTLAGNILVSPDSLYSGQQLAYGNYRFIMQGDCNLVLYDGGSPIWASNTYNKATNCRVVMQSDGNLVLYSGSFSPLWASNTNGKSGTYRCILQADRNVVVYGPDSGGAYGPPRWSTGTYIGKTGINLQGHSVAASKNNTLT